MLLCATLYFPSPATAPRLRPPRAKKKPAPLPGTPGTHRHPPATKQSCWRRVATSTVETRCRSRQPELAQTPCPQVQPRGAWGLLASSRAGRSPCVLCHPYTQGPCRSTARIPFCPPRERPGSPSPHELQQIPRRLSGLLGPRRWGWCGPGRADGRFTGAAAPRDRVWSNFQADSWIALSPPRSSGCAASWHDLPPVTKQRHVMSQHPFQKVPAPTLPRLGALTSKTCTRFLLVWAGPKGLSLEYLLLLALTPGMPGP